MTRKNSKKKMLNLKSKKESKNSSMKKDKFSFS